MANGMPGTRPARRSACRKPVAAHARGLATTVGRITGRRFAMASNNKPVTVAVLDDYQGAALRLADSSGLDGRAAVTVFNAHLANPDAVVERLKGFEVLCVMRERTPLPRATLERLPKLKLIVSTGARNASIDSAAAAERGVAGAVTGYTPAPPIEMTWARILAASRHVV